MGICTRAHGGQKAAVARVEGRHGARAVDADQPVGLRAAARGAIEALHLRVAAQVVETVARIAWGVMLCSHRRLIGLPAAPGAACVLLDQAEDQFALAPGVAGVDEFGHVLALAWRTTAARRLLVLSTGFRSKCGGITGRWASSTCRA